MIDRMVLQPLGVAKCQLKARNVNKKIELGKTFFIIWLPLESSTNTALAFKCF
jgi:hypothetical protein